MSIFPHTNPFTLKLVQEGHPSLYVHIDPRHIFPDQGASIDDVVWTLLSEASPKRQAQWNEKTLRAWDHFDHQDSDQPHPIARVQNGAVERTTVYEALSDTITVELHHNTITVDGQTHPRFSGHVPSESDWQDPLSVLKALHQHYPETLPVAFGVWDGLLDRRNSLPITPVFDAIATHTARLLTLTTASDYSSSLSYHFQTAHFFSSSMTRPWLVRPNCMPTPQFWVRTPRYHQILDTYASMPNFAKGFEAGRALHTAADGCPFSGDFLASLDLPSHVFTPPPAHVAMQVHSWNARIGSAVADTLQAAGLSLPGLEHL